MQQKNELPMAQIIKNKIEEMIINNELVAGTKLEELDLANQFNVSRTPIREALRNLEASQLVTIIPKKGAYVSEISVQKLIEIFEVVAELESLCAKLASRRISEKNSKLLLSALEKCQKAYDDKNIDKYFIENLNFHKIIYESSHNDFLITQMNQLKTRLLPFRKVQLRVRNRMELSMNEHKLITDAILNGEETLAQELMRNHVLIQGELFTDMVALSFVNK
ncbi:GntR family transcriptional regulator [Arcobacter sp. KX21116]|uniref:GntR family transcriptional regulator n=1 Tax=Arcobacter TaxID=28196 RepID=UPI0035D43A56